MSLVRLREIPGVVGYDVTDDGRVFSRWQRLVIPGRGSRYIEGVLGRELASFDRKDIRGAKTGYLTVKVANKNRYVHELVLLAFVGPRPEGGYEACHGNGIRSDNRLENLRWGTVRENYQDRVDAGTQYFHDFQTGGAFDDLLETAT